MPPAKSRTLIAGSRPKKKAVSRQHKSNLYGQIRETKFRRYIQHDLAQYQAYLDDGGAAIYSADELNALADAGISDRLPPRATGYYLDLAKRSEAVRNLIKARPEETDDLSGESDPSNQLSYSPIPGLLHKYELVLLYVVRTCSAWCRYCYRSDFLTGKTEKDTASIHEIVDYITGHNKKVEAGLTSRPKIREALLSGGDPMVLSNRNLFDYLNGLAEAGLDVIRIGTKELAFFPERFDENFFAMLDLFHELHPQVLVSFMVHFTHPDEVLLLDEDGGYFHDEHGRPMRNPKVAKAVSQLRARSFVNLENQTPIIDSVNDSVEDLRLLQREMKRMGINNHYFFQCREIEGHRAFAVPVEDAFALHRESQHALSGIERSRFALSTEAGKMEVVGMTDPQPQLRGLAGPLGEALADGLIIFRLHRTPYQDRQGDLVIARRNPDALWISGYEDRILFDGRKQAANEQIAPLLALIEPELVAAE
jgi:L-lysine 2,3-aminomutase